MISTYELPNDRNEIDLYMLKDLNGILNLMDYDIGKIMMFNDDKSCVMAQFTHTKTGAGFVEYENQIISTGDDAANNLIELLLEEKQIITLDTCAGNYYKGKEYTPLLNGIKKEILIPLYNHLHDKLDIIGCLYLGTYNADLNICIDLIMNEEFLSKLQGINGRFSLHYNQYKDKRSFLNSIHVLDNIVKIHEPFMINHQYNVANWSLILAKSFDLSAEEIEGLYVAALLHDVGKLYIPEYILNKKTKLSEDEYDTIKNHVIYSQQIAKDLLTIGEYDSKYISQVVKCHHERYDGTGYPEGLAGTSIPLESRIIGVADAVDAMLSQRSYKEPKPIEEVITDISQNRGKQFEPVMADIMIDNLLNVSLLLNEALDEPIILGTLNIETKTGISSWQGNMILGENGYIFEPFQADGVRMINVNEIIRMFFYVEKGKKIYEYETRLHYISGNRIYISELVINPSCHYIDMVWDLEGILYFDLQDPISINIVRISADSLMFTLSEEYFNDIVMRRSCRIDICFEDGVILPVTGIVTRKFEMGYKSCCDYKFAWLPPNVRTVLLSKVFKKQADLETLKTQTLC